MSCVADVVDATEVDWEWLAACDPDPLSAEILSAELPSESSIVDQRSPGQILDDLLSQECAELDADHALTMIEQAEWLAGCAQAVQYAALARFAEGYPAEFAAAELGPALGWSRQSASNRLHRAGTLAHRLPGTLAGLRRGALDYSKAAALADLTTPLSDADAATVAATVLPNAEGATLRQFSRRVRTAVTTTDPRGAAERAQQARRDRRMCLTPLDDGVTELFAVLRAEDAAAVSARVERKAHELRDGTIEQRRADALVALILGAQGATVTVQVTVPATTLLGVDENPGELVGYGPVSAETARELAAGGTWRRILTDPRSGAVLDYGRTRYTPSRALRDHVCARDRTCRFPGCEHPASRCDLDHTQSYESGGTTAHHNLGAFCRHHHRLKHETDWTIVQPAPGEFRFTSPLGRTYTRGPG